MFKIMALSLLVAFGGIAATIAAADGGVAVATDLAAGAAGPAAG